MEFDNTAAAIIFSPGPQAMAEFDLPTGIGSTPEIIAVNDAWIWSVLSLKMSTNGSRDK